jgi:hypothetical protein
MLQSWGRHNCEMQSKYAMSGRDRQISEDTTEFQMNEKQVK